MANKYMKIFRATKPRSGGYLKRNDMKTVMRRNGVCSDFKTAKFPKTPTLRGYANHSSACFMIKPRLTLFQLKFIRNVRYSVNDQEITVRAAQIYHVELRVSKTTHKWLWRTLNFSSPKAIEGTNIKFLVPRVRGAIPNTFSGFTCRLLTLVRSRGPSLRSRGQPFNNPRTKPAVVHSITTNYQSYIPRLNSTKQRLPLVDS